MIEIKELVKNYKKDNVEIPVLQSLNVSIEQNESVAILGDSGSGKTTLLSLMGGLEKPSSGDILIEGTSLVKLDQKELTQFRSKNLGIVFQQYHLMDYLTAKENITLPLEINGINFDEASKKALQLLSEVGLSHRADHLPSQLSGGECQRVAIARALVTNPKIILADEHTGSLDSKTGKNVMDLLFNLKQQHNITLVMVTHNETLAQRCNRVLKMSDGQLL